MTYCNMYNIMQADSLPLGTLSPLTPGEGSKGKINIFSESGPIAYQIKGNEAENKMQAKKFILPAPQPLGWG